jgi:NTP pyrophosphatase (non-canonical NTP hydrolase)
MLNTLEIQKETLEDTVRLGYTVNKQTTIDKLIEEIEEFQISEKLICSTTPRLISNTQCDKQFKREYEKFVVGTEEDELPDLVKVIMSYCEFADIDLETCIMNKHRYNKLRNKK